VWSAGLVRVYLAPLPAWVAVQYGFFVFLAFVLACFARLKWGGWRDSMGFSVSLVLFGGYGTIEMVGGLYLDFHFLQFVVNCLGGWICVVGLSPSILYGVM
jgi:hypothetical protein